MAWVLQQRNLFYVAFFVFLLKRICSDRLVFPACDAGRGSGLMGSCISYFLTGCHTIFRYPNEPYVCLTQGGLISNVPVDRL